MRVRSGTRAGAGTLPSTSVCGESVFFLTFCGGRRDGIQELRNSSAFVKVRVAVLNIDHGDDQLWNVREGRSRPRPERDLKNAEVSGRSLKCVAFKNLRSDYNFTSVRCLISRAPVGRVEGTKSSRDVIELHVIDLPPGAHWLSPQDRLIFDEPPEPREPFFGLNSRVALVIP